MREILFHGKRKDTGEWVEGFYVHFVDSWKNCETHRIYLKSAETDCGDYYPDWYEVNPGTVGQFTGLYDKNRKKIFEGDVCRNTKNKEIVWVAWHGTMAGYVWSKKEKSFLCDFGELFRAHDKYEIIGNVYDNPELLKGG